MYSRTLPTLGTSWYGQPSWTPTNARRNCWYRVAGLVSREQKDLAVEIIEAEIRSAVHEVLFDAAKLVLSDEPIEIARRLRDRAERTIRPPGHRA
jgi:hypothetical protein